MKIVTDTGTDVGLTPEEAKALNITIVPLSVSLDGKTYREGIDIQTDAFYNLLDNSENMPTTSQPSAGDFAAVYRKLAKDDPDILSIHMTSGLSGTFNSAVAAAAMVPEANITLVDTKTLSAAAGWQVKTAARALKADWSLDRILAAIKKIGDAAESVYTLKELKYLINGGRISHMKGVIASMLNIKPIIGVEKVGGTYAQYGQARTFKKALETLAGRITKDYGNDLKMRVQVLHSADPEAGETLRQMVDERFDCVWEPFGKLSLVLGAHTGRTMVGLAYAPEATFEGMP